MAVAKAAIGYPLAGEKEEKRTDMPESLVCDFCRLVKDGIVAKPGNGVFCVECCHNPDKNTAAKLLEPYL
jgi:hypothetical protein